MQTHLDSTHVTKTQFISLLTLLEKVPDPRVNRTKEHELVDVLTIGVCTLLCAGGSFNDMEDFGHAKEEWFRTFLSLRNGIPNHNPFNRVFAARSPQHFGERFIAWTQSPRAAVAQQLILAATAQHLELHHRGGTIYPAFPSMIGVCIDLASTQR